MGQGLTGVITFAVLGLIAYRLVGGLRRSLSVEGRRLIASVLRGVGLRHIWPVPLVLATIITVGLVLLMVPGLDWGWWTELGGDGNPVFGSSSATLGAVWEWVVPVLFIALLLPALPLFAYAEERLFRSGAECWPSRRKVLKVVQFGLFHALIGIPIGAALALSVGGAYFMRVYLGAYNRTRSRMEATLESTRAHTVYNAVIVGVVLSIVAIDAIT